MSDQTSTPIPPPEKKSSRTVLIIGASLATIMIIIVLFAYVFIPFIYRPIPEVTLVEGHDSLQGFDIVFIVDANVKNNGGDGYVKVYADISGYGRYEKQDQRVYLVNGESRIVKFTFDVNLWGILGSPSITYRAWAVAD